MLSKRLMKESFIELLQQKNIHKISVRELCQNAGINHCTFYKYYGSQYDLLKEMEDDLLKKVDSTLMESNGRSPLLTLLNYVLDNIDVARLLINNNIDPNFPEKLFSISFVQQEFDRLLSDRRVGRDYVTNFIFYGAFRIIQIWLNKENRESPEEMTELLMSILYNRQDPGIEQ